MRYDRRIIGYHATDEETGEQLLSGERFFKESRNDWDWLGHGAYFWEFGHQRAHDWASDWPRLRDKKIVVVGAIIQLGECLDLLDTDSTRLLSGFATAYQDEVGEIPANRGPSRKGDCFLINQFCEEMKESGRTIDTVRGLFQEGEPIYPGSMVLAQSHVQVAVRNPRAILGLFRPNLHQAFRSDPALQVD